MTGDTILPQKNLGEGDPWGRGVEAILGELRREIRRLSQRGDNLSRTSNAGAVSISDTLKTVQKLDENLLGSDGKIAEIEGVLRSISSSVRDVGGRIPWTVSGMNSRSGDEFPVGRSFLSGVSLAVPAGARRATVSAQVFYRYSTSVATVSRGLVRVAGEDIAWGGSLLRSSTGTREDTVYYSRSFLLGEDTPSIQVEFGMDTDVVISPSGGLPYCHMAVVITFSN